jgi:hypothetical protein
MKNKGSALFFLFLVAITGVWAQNLPGFPGNISSRHTWASRIWTSPQSSTTEGRYRSNADDFIRPDSYTGVKLDKWFGMASFLAAGEGIDEMIPTVGFATKVNNIYIGALYTGNLWTGLQVNNYTEREFVAAPIGLEAGKTYNVYDTINVSAAAGNNIALLIGVANMGFRLTWRTNHQAFKENDIVINDMIGGYILYKSYETDMGYMAPQIAWAMAKDLSENGIRPYAALDLVFYREFLKSQAADDTISGERIEYSKNRFDPAFSAGLGGYTLYNKDGFKLSGDLDYVLTINLYNNEYSYVENDVYKTGKINGTFSENSNPFVQEFFVSNSLTPSLSGSWSKDALSLKFKLNLPITLSSRESNGADIEANGTLFYKGLSVSTTTFTFRPDLRLAMQYKILPDRLNLNVGARIQATTLSSVKVDQISYDNDGSVVPGSKEKIHRDSVGNNFVSRFNFGAVFYFTENAWLEATTGVTNAFGDGAINVFSLGEGGLFAFGSVLFGLKF